MSQATLGETSYRNAGLFTNYYLANRVQDGEGWDCDEAATAAFEELQTLWERENELVDSYDEDELIDEWIQRVVEILGYETRTETTLPDGGGFTDLLLYESEAERRKAAESKRDGDVTASFATASAVLEAKQWGAAFDERFSEQRSYRDASHQLKYYLEHTPEDTDWGILTNGKQWRLYGTKDYATEIYYEVDLPELLANDDLEAFKYFFAFFRPAAFHETAGTSFLDTVWNESELAAQELGEDLQDSVFTAMRVLAEGFVETNDLSLDAGDDERLAELKEQSLVLLYRLMFVFYAESRGLIEPEEPDLRDEYAENFSLNTLRQEISERIQSGDDFDDFSEFSKTKWSRLEDLFDLVDTGEEQLDIPAYNGGLFDPEDNQFLTENEVADRYLAEVIYRIGTAENDDGEDVLADYADLDTRHLGSIYEGLLEHEFRIAPEDYAAVADDGGQVWKPTESVAEGDAVETVESGDLYVVNDDGERKATGAYYTPDYVVSYIVEETVDPLLAEIHEDLQADGLEESDREYFRRFYESVRELTVLDPAMGSGHFLTTTVQYLTEQVMQVAREQDVGFGEQEIRRSISKECIYGVDVNGMAVELAKLSMWLETLAADKPLAFLDHHLKTGNSLVGSNIYDVLSEEGEDGKQTTLFDDFREIRTKTLAHVRDLMDDLVAIDNDELGDIKQMEETYDEIRGDPLYRRLLELANVHTAERFGLDVPDGVYETMAEAIEHEDEWQADVVDTDWYRSAQMMAAEEGFFHWELEFPEVFLETGEESESGGVNSGFDAVVGNPPWGAELSENAQEFATFKYDLNSSASDSFAVFTSLSPSLTHDQSNIGYILPSGWQTSDKYQGFRQSIVEKFKIESIVNLPYDVFEDAYVDSSIFILSRNDFNLKEFDSEPKYADIINFDRKITISHIDSNSDISDTIDYTRWFSDHLDSDGTYEFLSYLTSEELNIEEKVAKRGQELSEVADVQRGITPFNLTDSTGPNFRPGLDGDLRRYRYSFSGDQFVEYHEDISEYKPPRYFEGDRLILRELISRQFRLQLARTSDDFVTNKSYQSILVEDDEYSLGYLLAVLNSKLVAFYHIRRSAVALRDDFPKIVLSETRSLPIPPVTASESELEATIEATDCSVDSKSRAITVETPSGSNEVQIDPNGDTQYILSELTETLMNLTDEYGQLNLNPLDYLGDYRDGEQLADIGFAQPPQGARNSLLQKKAPDKPNLKVESAEVTRESSDTVTIQLDIQHKPEDPENHETNRWGYTDEKNLAALEISGLSEEQIELVSSFVPVAVDESGGFANFRKGVTKSDSLIDRLMKLRLPKLEDVQMGLRNYREVSSRANELREKIIETDDTIDRIVYHLFELDESEVEIIEQSSITRKLFEE